MDSFFLLPAVLFMVTFAVFCGCFWLCFHFAKKQRKFPTVNRSGATDGRVNRSGPRFGGSTGEIYDEPMYEDNDPPFGFTTTPTTPPFGSTDIDFNPILNNTTVNTYGWNTTHTNVNKLPPSYTEATEILIGSSHRSHQNEYCDSDFRSHGVKGDGDDSGGKCDIDRDDSGGKTYDSNDYCGGTTYDSGGGDSGGGTCDSGGDTGGGDTGGGDSGTTD